MTGTSPTTSDTFPVLRLAAGLVFVLAGVFVYFRVNLGLSLALVLVLAGVVVLAVGFLGRKGRPLDVAILIVALIVFAGAASSVNYSASGSRTYIVAKSAISVSRIEIDPTAKFGSITVKFSGNADLGYQVTFGQTSSFFPFSFQLFGNNSNSLSNTTRDGTLFLFANSTSSDITITLGSGYVISINASTGTGSIEVDSTTISQRFNHVILSTGTGSIHAAIDTTSISDIYLQTGTGSVSFDSNYLSPSNSKVPITLTTGTGSITFNSKFPAPVGVDISASNGFGSISKNLTGFQVTQSSNGGFSATAGPTSGPSFEVTLSVGTGSINVKGSLVPPVP